MNNTPTGMIYITGSNVIYFLFEQLFCYWSHRVMFNASCHSYWQNLCDMFVID